MRINLTRHIPYAVALSLALAGCRESRPPTVSRAWPEMETMMSAAAWGSDSARVARALDAAHDSVDRIDSLFQRHAHIVALDSLSRDIRRSVGVNIPSDSLVAGYALDRAALALHGVVDSALLDLGGQYLWIEPAGRHTSRSVGIPDPDNSLRSAGTVEMRNGSVRTKLRPRGEIARTSSVTVLTTDALSAALWSNVLFSIGCDSALALAARLERGVSAVCADSSGVRWTPDLEKRVVVPRAVGQPKTPAAGRAGRAP